MNNWLPLRVRGNLILRGAMGQLGFFDAERRLARCRRQGDPLETIAGLVPRESFRADIEAVVKRARPAESRSTDVRQNV